MPTSATPTRTRTPLLEQQLVRGCDLLDCDRSLRIDRGPAYEDEYVRRISPSMVTVCFHDLLCHIRCTWATINDCATLAGIVALPHLETLEVCNLSCGISATASTSSGSATASIRPPKPGRLSISIVGTADVETLDALCVEDLRYLMLPMCLEVGCESHRVLERIGHRLLNAPPTLIPDIGWGDMDIDIPDDAADAAQVARVTASAAPLVSFLAELREAWDDYDDAAMYLSIRSRWQWWEDILPEVMVDAVGLVMDAAAMFCELKVMIGNIGFWGY